MSERVSVSGQYDDFTGVLAAEGFDHITTMSLSIGCPKGFWPVGFRCYASRRDKDGALEFQFYSLAVDEAILDKRGADGVSKYAREHGQVPVFEFHRPKVKLADLLSEIKCVNLIFQDSCTERVPLMLVDGDTSHDDEDEFDDGDDDAFEGDSELDDNGNDG